MDRTKELFDEILAKQRELVTLIDEFESVSTIGLCGTDYYKQIQVEYSQDFLTLAKLYKKQIIKDPWEISFDIDGTEIFAVYDEEDDGKLFWNEEMIIFEPTEKFKEEK